MTTTTPGRPSQIPLSVLAVVAVALVLRFIHLSSAVISPLSFQLGPDEDYYFRFARAVAAGVGQDSAEFTFMDPGYGYLLGGVFRLVGPGVFAAYLLQCLVDALTSLAVVMLGRQLGRPRAGLIGGVLYGVSSTAIMFCCSLLKEVWVAAFMTWWVVIVLRLLHSERKIAWLAFGAFCGVAVAFRSTLLTLSLAALAVPWISGPILKRPVPHRLVCTAAFTMGLLLALAPWSLRNFAAYHSLSPLPHNGGIVLDQAYNPHNPESAIWIPEFVNYLAPSEIWRGYAAEAKRRAGNTLTPPEVDRYWRSQALEFMRTHPREVLEEVGRKALKFFASVDIPINRSLQEEGLFSVVIARLPVLAPWLVALGCVGLLWLALEDRRWLVVAVPPAIALLTTAVFWAEDRFRFHAFAVLALCSGIWLDAVLREVQSRKFKPALAFGVAAAALLSASFALGAGVRSPPLHWDQIAWGYIKMGRPREAGEIVERVSREQPDNAPILEAEAYLAIQRQDYAAAAQAYENSLRIRPRSDRAHFNLAKAYLMLNKRNEAVEQARIALQLKPDPDYQQLLKELQSSP